MSRRLRNSFENADQEFKRDGTWPFNLNRPLSEIEDDEFKKYWRGFGPTMLKEFHELRGF